MEEVYLTVKELAELKNCTERAIQKNIEINNINFVEIENQIGGRDGIQYRIPFSTLDSKLKLKYKRLKKKEAKALENNEDVDINKNDELEEKTNLQDLSLEEREEIIFWKILLKNWREFRSQSESSFKEADESFVQQMKIKH